MPAVGAETGRSCCSLPAVPGSARRVIAPGKSFVGAGAPRGDGWPPSCLAVSPSIGRPKLRALRGVVDKPLAYLGGGLLQCGETPVVAGHRDDQVFGFQAGDIPFEEGAEIRPSILPSISTSSR